MSKCTPSLGKSIARIVTFLMVASCPNYVGIARGEQPAQSDAAPAAATPSAVNDNQPAATAEAIERTIAALDDDEFAARQNADRRLAHWAADPRAAPLLSEQIARLLLATDISLEARTQLESLQKRLPAARVASAFRESEIVPLLNQLSEGSYVERDGAARRLRAMMNDVELIGPLLIELKHRADDPQLTTDRRRLLEPLLDTARHAWLLADPAKVKLPAASADEIGRRIETLTADDEQPQDRFRRQFAERELADLIMRDDTRAAVLEQLAARITVADDAATAGTLRHITDLARPGIAAEVWHSGAHITVQYLLLGVPQHNEGAERPTHFDRADEQTAHCVSGNTLVEGNYPVRVAIPHPDPNGPSAETMFFLTNLPTPRRRLLYEYDLKRDPATRLTEISERTTEHFLASRVVLNENQVVMLAQLDPHVVSRFAGRYFQAVADQRLDATIADFIVQSAKVNTVHTGICCFLARLGTHEAVPALTELARSGKLAIVSGEKQINFAWIAALAIAQRDPWPGVDEWLISLLDDNTTLVEGVDPPPQLGATAAAMLLDRHDVSAQGFGLYLTSETPVGWMRFAGHRFDAPEKDRQDIRRWWQKQKRMAPKISIP